MQKDPDTKRNIQEERKKVKQALIRGRWTALS